MSKIGGTEKFKELSERRLRKVLKRRKKKAGIIRDFKRSLEGKTQKQIKEIKRYKDFDKIKAPENLSFLENTEEVVDFIGSIESALSCRRKVMIILSKVKDIDNGAIAVLLSVMYLFKENRIPFNGNFPENVEVRKKLEDSEFFDRLYKPLPEDPADGYSFKKENQIFVETNRKVVAAIGLKIIEDASETIWNSKRVCRGFQRVLLELMQNTNNHASVEEEGRERWWLSVNHNRQNKKVSFSFVDYGQGILKSLESRKSRNVIVDFFETVKELVEKNSGHEVIRLLLDGQHREAGIRNMAYYRGKGLPGIKAVLEKNQISNLYIITNKTFSDVKGDRFLSLRGEFKGTFIYWELCQNNVNQPWTI